MNVDISGVDLTGQVAIVTGSGRGLSRSMAQVLEAAGAVVALVVKTERERAEMMDLIDSINERLSIVVVDNENRTAVERIVKNFKDQNGFIALVVNITDAAQLPVALWQLDPGEWSNMLEANLRSSLVWTKAALTEIATGGRIINIADAPMFSRLMSSLTVKAKARGVVLFSVDSSVASDLVKKLILFLASGRADNLSGHYVRVNDGIVAPTIEIEPDNVLRLNS